MAFIDVTPVDTLPYDEGMIPEDRQDFERVEMALFEKAEEARKRARHYDDYRLGTCWLWRDREGGLFEVQGWNLKRRRNMPGRTHTKLCAEKTAWIKAARGPELLYPIGMVLLSPPREDDGTGIQLPFRLPCEVCRPWMFRIGIPAAFIISSRCTETGRCGRLTFRQALHIFPDTRHLALTCA